MVTTTGDSYTGDCGEKLVLYRNLVQNLSLEEAVAKIVAETVLFPSS